MSLHQIIVIERRASLSVDKKRLKICIDDEKHFFAFSDVAVLYLDYIGIQLSSSVLQACAKANTVVLVSDKKHMPSMMGIPYGYNNQCAKRSILQCQYLDTDMSRHWWKEIIKSRIITQAETLRELDCEGSGLLSEYTAQVLPGDSTMVEAKAARVYWDALFGESFLRHKQGATDLINSSLNYGFAIVRAAMARVLISYGLHLSFGVGHCRKDNPFNLVEDMTEPFRFMVERYVFKSMRSKCSDNSESFDAAKRADLLKVLDASVKIKGKTYRSISAMEIAAQSFCRVLENNAAPLILPSAMVGDDYDFPQHITQIR